MRTWLIKKLGGYAAPQDVPLKDVFSVVTIEDVADYLRDLNLNDRQTLLTMAVKRLFNTIGPDDILRIHNKTQWTWQGRPLNEAQIKQLQAETKAFSESYLWKVLSAELRYQGNKKIYTQSRDVPDLVAAKLLFYYIDIVETRLKQMLQ